MAWVVVVVSAGVATVVVVVVSVVGVSEVENVMVVSVVESVVIYTKDHAKSKMWKWTFHAFFLISFPELIRKGFAKKLVLRKRLKRLKRYKLCGWDGVPSC